MTAQAATADLVDGIVVEAKPRGGGAAGMTPLPFVVPPVLDAPKRTVLFRQTPVQ
jgi:hypothetical protein